MKKDARNLLIVCILLSVVLIYIHETTKVLTPANQPDITNKNEPNTNKCWIKFNEIIEGT